MQRNSRGTAKQRPRSSTFHTAAWAWLYFLLVCFLVFESLSCKGDNFLGTSVYLRMYVHLSYCCFCFTLLLALVLRQRFFVLLALLFYLLLLVFFSCCFMVVVLFFFVTVFYCLFSVFLLFFSTCSHIVVVIWVLFLFLLTTFKSIVQFAFKSTKDDSAVNALQGVVNFITYTS